MGKVTTQDINRLRDKLCCLIENTDDLETILGGVATEATLQMVLSSIQDGQDFEAKLVVDDDGDGATYLEVRIWNPDTQTWEDPLYYAPGSNTGIPLASLTAPILYINPNTLLSQIASNTTGLNLEATQQLVLAELISIDNNVADVATETTLSALSTWITTTAATETTLAALNAKFNTLGQKLSAASTPVVLSTEQEAILSSIDIAINALDLSPLATEVTLQATNTLLATIDTVLDNIKLDTANLDVALSTIASEATLAAIETVLNNIKLDTANFDVSLSSRLNTLGRKAETASAPVVLSDEDFAALEAIRVAVQNLDVDVDGIATEVTLAALLAAFNAEDFATETTLAALAATDFANQTTLAALLVAFNAEDFASETTLALVDSNIVLGNITLNSLLTAFNAEDFATETTLAALLTAFNAEDFATETTLNAIKLDTANLDVALSTRLNTLGRKAETASAPVVLSDEDFASLEAIRVAVQNLDVDVDGIATEVTLSALLTAFNAEDFATETTLAALAGTDFATQTTLAALLTAFNAEDFASQTTLQALLTAFNAEDFSTETTLAALLAAFNAEDFATETTLNAIKLQTDQMSFDGNSALEVSLPTGVVSSRYTRLAGIGSYTVVAGNTKVSVLNYGSVPVTVDNGLGPVQLDPGIGLDFAAPEGKTLGAITTASTSASALVAITQVAN